MAQRDTQTANPRQGQGHAQGQNQGGGQGLAQQGGPGMTQGGQGMAGGQHPDHTEGVVARSIEHYTAQLPSDTFLWAAAGSIGLSLCCRLAGNKEDANFFGHWAPTFLILGLYNKLVKVAGSDPQHRGLAGGPPQTMTRGAGI
jgi:hypothetical protein